METNQLTFSATITWSYIYLDFTNRSSIAIVDVDVDIVVSIDGNDYNKQTVKNQELIKQFTGIEIQKNYNKTSAFECVSKTRLFLKLRPRHMVKTTASSFHKKTPWRGVELYRIFVSKPELTQDHSDSHEAFPCGPEQAYNRC